MSLGPGSSAILDLKAELLRKRNQAKSHHKAEKVSEDTVRKGGFRIERREPKESRCKKGVTDIPPPDDKDDEEANALAESRRRLEEKTRRYEAMSSSSCLNPASLSFDEKEDDDAMLVDFGAKRRLKIQEAAKQRHAQRARQDEAPPPRDSDDSDDNDSDSEWTTFTDSLGRTRKCLKTELSHFLREDDRLQKSLEKNCATEIIRDIPLPSSTSGSGNTSHDGVGANRRPVEDPEVEERLRRWADMEQENAAKEHIHYRDVLFDEVREHGQAHFEFSRNEAERSEQLKILDRLREESTRAQKSAQDVKKRKQDILQQRLARIRERKGLPPAELEEQTKSDANGQTANVKSPAVPTATTAPPSRIRPWDEGKEVHGVPIRLPAGTKRSGSAYEDYIENRREERLTEFAPPSIYNYASQRNQTGGQIRKSTNSSASAEVHEDQREPTGADLDEFFKTMRNLS